jgi:eukaryotic-like serine/threonine-protein kinase
MKWLSDHAVDRLRSAIEVPDLSGTRYRPLQLLGRGGMGVVWLAEDTALNRKVALKILDIADEKGALAVRLLREAEILASLEHPGIVPVHDAGTLPDGSVFYCMKYVQGQTLDQYVNQLKTIPERLRLVQRLAEPLAFAHSKGVLHRDLKPANIMIGPFGEALVMDWGLAKRTVVDEPIGTGGLSSAMACPPLANGTSTGVVGTPGFMAPQQARGEPADERSDVFSLGAVMLFILTNGAPNDVQGFAGLPRPLKAICGKAMVSDPAARYQSVDDLASDLSRFLEQSPVSAYQENIFDRVGRLAKRHGTAIVLVLAYLLMRVLFIIFARR